jgi:PAS domain S-box-containing protein
MPENNAWMCERIVQETQLGIIFADAQGTMRLWNAGAEAMFGFTAEEAVGHSMDMIIPERHRAKHWEGYDRVMKTGVSKYGRDVLAVPALRKDGTRISIEFTIAILRNSSGEILGAAAMIQDVSARWERDKALRAELASLKARMAQLEATAPSGKAEGA